MNLFMFSTITIISGTIITIISITIANIITIYLGFCDCGWVSFLAYPTLFELKALLLLLWKISFSLVYNKY
jgi:hypothetical protein